MTMFNVLRLAKIAKTDPQEYELRLYDSRKEQLGYVGTTHYGTENELRVILEVIGMSKMTIGLLFTRAYYHAEKWRDR